MNDKEEMRAVDCGMHVCKEHVWKPSGNEQQVFVCRMCEGVEASPDANTTTQTSKESSSKTPGKRSATGRQPGYEKNFYPYLFDLCNLIYVRVMLCEQAR